MSTRLSVTRFAPRPDTARKDARERGRLMISDAVVDRARIETAARVDTLARALAGHGVLPADPPVAADVVREFEAAFARRPIVDNDGGAMRNNAFWLFAVARLLRPSSIVESGTWRGFSSWLFAEAAPGARITTYDVRRANGRIDDPRVDYRLGDWNEAAAPDRLPADTLFYADDHLPHLRRLEEAAARGIRLVLVDDDYPAHALYATGTPPVPTVAMLTDPEPIVDRPIIWERDGKRYGTMMTSADLVAARDLIAWTVPMPDLTPVNRYVQQAPATLVGLRAS